MSTNCMWKEYGHSHSMYTATLSEHNPCSSIHFLPPQGHVISLVIFPPSGSGTASQFDNEMFILIHRRRKQKPTPSHACRALKDSCGIMMPRSHNKNNADMLSAQIS